MNDKNLISIGTRTKNEQREITRKGGIKSGEARRRKKQMKQLITELLQSEPDPIETIGLDVDDVTTRAALLARSIYTKALQGDVRAFEALMKYSGEDPEQQRKDAELKLKRELLKFRTGTDTERQEPAIRARAALMAKINAEMAKAEAELNQVIIYVPDDGREKPEQEIDAAIIQ